MTKNRVLPLLAALVVASLAWTGGARAADTAASATAALNKWKAGTNYKLVANPQPTNVAAGKVEVSEVFWYGCGHCYALDPSLESWKQTLAPYVEFVRVPVIWGALHRQHAKLYYTIQALHRLDLHTKVFDAIHREGLQLTGRTEEQVRSIHFAFLNREGVSEKEFNAAYDSMTVAANIARAENLTKNLQVSSVPVMFVNGKFSTSVDEAGGTAEMLALVNDLAASEKNPSGPLSVDMLSAFIPQPQGLARFELRSGAAIPAESIWLDLVEPTPAEEKQVESFLSIDVPTRDEMREIEASNRLYEEDGALYMTATVVTKLDSDLPESTQITFILSSVKLVTNRYVDPLPFRRFIAYAERHPNSCNSPPAVLAGLVESIVNRVADVIERVATDLDGASVEVFSASRRKRGVMRDFRKVLERLGQNGELISKARESLVSLGRLLTFVQQSTAVPMSQEVRGRFRTLTRDVMAMSDHASFLGTKVSFILDATLGLINIDQNNILKIFSVVTVFLLPPSVIGAVFGMNFSKMPWLHEPWGFWAAMGIMLVSAIGPFVFFKRKGWL